MVNDKQEVGPEKRYVSTRIAKVVGLNPTRVICRDIFFKGLGGGESTEYTVLTHISVRGKY